MRVLVADDDVNDAFFLSHAFEKADLNAVVHYVRDGQELMDYLEGKAPFLNQRAYPMPHMLILDLNLPRFDGFQVLSWLRESTRLRHLPVIILSGSAEPGAFQRAFELGALEFFVKPQDPRQLVPMVKEVEKLWREVSAAAALQETLTPVSAPAPVSAPPPAPVPVV